MLSHLSWGAAGFPERQTKHILEAIDRRQSMPVRFWLVVSRSAMQNAIKGKCTGCNQTECRHGLSDPVSFKVLNPGLLVRFHT